MGPGVITRNYRYKWAGTVATSKNGTVEINGNGSKLRKKPSNTGKIFTFSWKLIVCVVEVLQNVPQYTSNCDSGEFQEFFFKDQKESSYNWILKSF